MFETFIRTDEGDCFLFQKYGDRYSLVAANDSIKGSKTMKWCYPQTRERKPSDKAIPMGCHLGTRTAALKIINRLKEILENAPKATYPQAHHAPQHDQKFIAPPVALEPGAQGAAED